MKKQSYYHTESLKKQKPRTTWIYFSPKGHKAWNPGSSIVNLKSANQLGLFEVAIESCS